MVNYNTAYSKAAHKYLFKAFYNKTNKKEYKLQVWQYNIWYTNIIAIKKVIILKKTKEKMLSKGSADITVSTEMA